MVSSFSMIGIIILALGIFVLGALFGLIWWIMGLGKKDER